MAPVMAPAALSWLGASRALCFRRPQPISVRARSRTGRQQRVDRDAAKDAHALSAPCSPLTAMAFKLSVRDGSQCKIGCPRFVLSFGLGLGLASGKLAGAPCGFGAVGGNLRRGPARQFEVGIRDAAAVGRKHEEVVRHLADGCLRMIDIKALELLSSRGPRLERGVLAATR